MKPGTEVEIPGGKRGKVIDFLREKNKPSLLVKCSGVEEGGGVVRVGCWADVGRHGSLSSI